MRVNADMRYRERPMWWFLIGGGIIGGTVMALVMAALCAGGRADEEMERQVERMRAEGKL